MAALFFCNNSLNLQHYTQDERYKIKDYSFLVLKNLRQLK